MFNGVDCSYGTVHSSSDSHTDGNVVGSIQFSGLIIVMVMIV